jgi:hypothetical protein
VPVQTTNKWFPEATQQDPEGLYILQSLPPPNRELLPQEFTSDSRSGFDATFRKIQELYTNLQPEVVRQWEEFALSVPSNDSVQDHLRDHPDSMHIPFRDLLFSFSPEEGSANNNSAIQLGDDFQSSRKRKDIQMQQLRSTDSVSWSRRNKKLRKNDPNSGLRVANDCPPAIYESKSNNNRRKNKTTTDSSSPQSETSLNNSSRKKTSSSSSRSQIVKKTNRRKKTYVKAAAKVSRTLKHQIILVLLIQLTTAQLMVIIAATTVVVRIVMMMTIIPMLKKTTAQLQATEVVIRLHLNSIECMKLMMRSLIKINTIIEERMYKLLDMGVHYHISTKYFNLPIPLVLAMAPLKQL